MSKLLAKLRGEETDPTKPKKEDEKAMDLIVSWASKGKKKDFPPKLDEYLRSHDLLSVAVNRDVPGLENYALSFPGKIKVAPASQTPAGSKTFEALVVPMVKRGTDGNAISSFPAGRFLRLDLAKPDARVIVTSMLVGCTFVVGFSKHEKNVLYLGHAQPTEVPRGANASQGANLARHFREANAGRVFDGVELSKWEVYGKDEQGYGAADSAKAAVMGWVSDNKLFLTFKSTETQKPFVVREYHN